ncbi:MAG: hypothetical protein R3C68_13500 [Myxococcota bacterium]
MKAKCLWPHAGVAGWHHAGSWGDGRYLVSAEHSRVLTLGRNGASGNILVSEENLRQLGVELFRPAAAAVTYHGPGQIVGYLIIALQEDERDIRRYVTYLEEVMIRTALDYGVRARRVEGLRGIWVGNDKLGAVGVRLAQWTTSMVLRTASPVTSRISASLCPVVCAEKV